MQIELGAMSDSIASQLEAQGLQASGKSVELLDRLANAISIAHIHGCLTDSECSKARKRLAAQIRVKPTQATPNAHE